MNLFFWLCRDDDIFFIVFSHVIVSWKTMSKVLVLLLDFNWFVWDSDRNVALIQINTPFCGIPTIFEWLNVNWNMRLNWRNFFRLTSSEKLIDSRKN